MTFVRGSTQRTQRQTVITDNEFLTMLSRAAEIKHEFLRLRAKALLCVLRLTGKRRSEIAMLQFGSFKVEKGFLNITFTLLKKRKGTVLTKQATKSIPLSDPLTEPILVYLEYLNSLDPKPKYLLPRVKTIFGSTWIICTDSHISGRQVANVIRGLSEKVWCHLFRETAASDVIKTDPSIIGAFKVMRRLDLKDYRTGFNYLRRFASDIIMRETGSKSGVDVIRRSS